MESKAVCASSESTDGFFALLRLTEKPHTDINAIWTLDVALSEWPAATVVVAEDVRAGVPEVQV